MMKRRDVLALGLAAVSTRALGARPAFAQGKYPDRPIRLVIPFAPGGVNDVIGRMWADRVKDLLGQVVIENQGGAGGSVGGAAVARAQPDGYTLLLGGGGSQLVNPLAGKPLYDPLKDFESIAMLAITALTATVHPSLPVQNLKELIDYANANPGKLSYGSAGVGSFNHLTGELFKSLIKRPDIVHVPYKGAGPAMNDLVSGHILFATPNVTGPVIQMLQTGKVRILAVTTPKRLVALPDIPTAVEAGLPGMISQNFVGLYAPAKTPKEIVEQIARATQTAMADKEFQQKLITSGFEVSQDTTPEKARRFLEDEHARWRPIIQAIGLKLD
jgi:tripartite-type tricarboxylate transporter receptor subunit TctC